MSNKCITWALNQKTASPTTKLILFKLADQANDDGVCWPSQGLMAKHCECNRSTINRHIKKLSDAGLIEIEHRSKDGVSLPNIYRLRVHENVGVGARCNRGGRSLQQGVGAQEHTNPQLEPSLNPHTENHSPCPHQEIINLYHEILPFLRPVVEWDATRASHLRQRWIKDPKRQNLDWWRKFFAVIAESDFLCGRVPSKDRKPFEADLAWIVKSANFLNILEGRYDN